MIITIEDLRNRIDNVTGTDEQITTRLKGIEAVIREYTNNNFQMRSARFIARSVGFNLYGVPQFIAVGDTVQISLPSVNAGLYVVTAVADDHIEIDGDLYFWEEQLVTKIVYPADVVQCAVDLFKWKQTMGDKVGIKSETLSRHSVTYEDSNTLFLGYPVGILNGLNLHMKARC